MYKVSFISTVFRNILGAAYSKSQHFIIIRQCYRVPNSIKINEQCLGFAVNEISDPVHVRWSSLNKKSVEPCSLAATSGGFCRCSSCPYDFYKSVKTLFVCFFNELLDRWQDHILHPREKIKKFYIYATRSFLKVRFKSLVLLQCHLVNFGEPGQLK